MSTVTVIPYIPYVHPGPDPLEDIPVLPDEPVTRRDVLLRAADLLEEKGWVTEVFVDRYEQYGGGFCLCGAIGHAAGKDHDLHDHDGWMKFVGGYINGVDAVTASFWNTQQKDAGGVKSVTAALRSLANGATWEEATAA